MEQEIVKKLSGIELTEDEETLISLDDTIETEGVEEMMKELGVVGKLISGRFPPVNIVKKILGEAWKLKKDFDIQVTRDNNLRLQLYCQDDKNKVLLGGPWHLERQLLMFKEISPDLDLKTLVFSKADFWVRIRELPLKWRNLQMAKKIGEMFGGFVRWDELHSGVSSEFLRLRVTIQVMKPLIRVVKLQGKEGPISYKVGYERLPIYYFRCGLLGHLKRSCAKELQSQTDEEDPYGAWLRAESALRRVSWKEKETVKNLTKVWAEVKAEKENRLVDIEAKNRTFKRKANKRILRKIFRTCPSGKKETKYSSKLGWRVTEMRTKLRKNSAPLCCWKIKKVAIYLSQKEN
ncbi:unnamed protein product [Linum trigynum]|uniref:DUF4283 domain-containing protein n=1 Tax=Linum trigynum TaxID=586398 RepID=A0AAV2DVT8_9ROSI